MPLPADLVAAGGPVVTRTLPAAIAPYTPTVPLREPGRCEPTEIVTEQPILAYIFHGAYANLDTWVRTGTPAPRAGRIEVKEVAGKPAIVTDESGNAVGGVRSPYVDAPTATYHSGHGTGPGCGDNFGYAEAFNWARLDEMYGSYKNYAAKVTRSLDRLVKDRWVTASDAQRVRTELLAPPNTTHASD